MTILRRWLLKKLNPNLWEGYNWEINREEPIERACFVVFDTETTGLDLSRDELLSIGAVKILGLRMDLSKSFYALLKPRILPRDSVKVHGITPQELERAKSRKEACEEFISYAWGCILSGYFLHIDMSMIRRLIKEECRAPFYPYTLDLLDIVEKKERIPTLEELLRSYRMPVSTFHNALEDAYMTALLLLRFLKEGGYKKLGDLPLRV